MSDTDAIVQDPVTGAFGFRLEMGRDHGGIRMQARRSGFVTETAAKTAYADCASSAMRSIRNRG